MSEKTGKEFPTSDVVKKHIEKVGAPPQKAVDAAGEIIKETYYSFGGKKNALGTSIELSTYISNSTTVLASMINSKDKSIPDKWKSNPEVARTILLICGEVESGLLKAQQHYLKHEGEGGNLQKRIDQVSEFLNDLNI